MQSMQSMQSMQHVEPLQSMSGMPDMHAKLGDPRMHDPRMQAYLQQQQQQHQRARQIEGQVLGSTWDQQYGGSQHMGTSDAVMQVARL